MTGYRVFDPLVQQLRAERLEQGRTMDDIAAATGLSRPHMSKLEAGGHSPSLSTLRVWSKALGLDLRLRKGRRWVERRTVE